MIQIYYVQLDNRSTENLDLPHSSPCCYSLSSKHGAFSVFSLSAKKGMKKMMMKKM